MTTAEDQQQRCSKCNGEGRVANTEVQEPWSQWLDLPVRNAAAVIIGLVRPISCPRCGGSGTRKIRSFDDNL